MSDERRRLLEPRTRLDRILYALMAALLPNAVLSTWHNPDLQWSSAILAAWWMIATFYTIAWALSAYRARCARPARPDARNPL